MRKVLAIVLMALVATTCLAQNKKQNARIKEIREMMTESMANIEANSEMPEYTDRSLHMQLNRMLPGSGMQHYKVDAYIEDCGDEEKMMQDWRPFFFRVKYNFAARESVREHLLCPSTGKPIFIFAKSQESEGITIEDRIYYYNDGTFCYATRTEIPADTGKKKVKVLRENEVAVTNSLKFFKEIFDWTKKAANLPTAD